MTEPYYGEDLIFIISLPRSGSTLLQRVLAGHPDVGASSEPWIMLHPVYGLRSKGISTDYNAEWAALGVREFLEHYTDGENVYDDAIRAFAATLYRNAMRKAGVRLFVDKTPRYVMIIDELIRLFPGAKFVFLIRNPLSVLSSIVNTQIDHDLTTLESFSHELLDGPDAVLNGIDALGERAIRVQYEAFVQNPGAELRMLCERLGISFEEDMLDYTNAPQWKGFMQDRTGITQHSRPTADRAESWKQLLTDEQQLAFARGYLDDLGPERVRRLGYSWEELDSAVRAAQRDAKKSPYLLPWHVAILAPEDKRGRDQMHVFRYRQIRDHGPVVGRLKTLAAYIGGVYRAVAFTLGLGRRGLGNAKRGIE